MTPELTEVCLCKLLNPFPEINKSVFQGVKGHSGAVVVKPTQSKHFCIQIRDSPRLKFPNLRNGLKKSCLCVHVHPLYLVIMVTGVVLQSVGGVAALSALPAAGAAGAAHAAGAPDAVSVSSCKPKTRQ